MSNCCCSQKEEPVQKTDKIARNLQSEKDVVRHRE